MRLRTGGQEQKTRRARKGVQEGGWAKTGEKETENMESKNRKAGA